MEGDTAALVASGGPGAPQHPTSPPSSGFSYQKPLAQTQLLQLQQRSCQLHGMGVSWHREVRDEPAPPLLALPREHLCLEALMKKPNVCEEV